MLITGARGFAIQLMDVCLQGDRGRVIYFYDDVNPDTPDQLFGRYPVLKSVEAVKTHFKEVSPSFALGTGKPSVRKMFFEKMMATGGHPETVISPRAVIGYYDVSIEQGCCVLTDTIIESTVTIGKGCLINLGVFITHGSTLGTFCELGPGAKIMGDCKIGNSVFLGAGAIVLPGVSIGDDAIIGAGAVVNKNIPKGSIAVGVPAKIINYEG